MGSLTADMVKNLTQPGRYGDGAGLYLVVAPGGTRSWTLRVQADGKRTDRGLGGYPTVTLAVARTRAEDLRVAVRQGSGTSKKARKQTAARAADTRGLTFREAAIRCRDILAPRWRAPKAISQWEQCMGKHVYPVIGDLQVAKVTSSDVRRVLEPIWTASPATARKVKQRVRTVFDWAVDMEHRESNPVGLFKFVLPPQPMLVNGHHRSLPYQDMPAALLHLNRHRERIDGANLDPQPWRVTLLALEFLILTATRSAETREARWDEIDISTATWTIPASRMKMSRPHRVPLSSQALDVLRQAREKLGRKSGLVFPTPSGRRLSHHSLSNRVKGDGLECVPHGFRSSFRNWAAELSGASREAIELSLAHAVSSTVEASYFRVDLLEQRRPLMEAWADFVNPEEESPF